MKLSNDSKILLSFVFAFILITGSIPFASITKAYGASSYDDNKNEYDGGGGDGSNNNNYNTDYLQKYELPPGFNQPTQDTPWPDEIIPADFPLRDACLDGKKIPKEFLSTFNVHAIEVDIVYNAFGFHDPDGRMYVLEEDKDKVLQKVAQNPGKNVPEVQPLAIRTNIGQCVEIKFTNDLRKEYASIHPTGVGLDPNKDDGTFVGFNEDTTVPPGQSITYRWFPDVEGAHFFSDAARQVVESDLSLLGDWASEELQSLRQHGLFGALMVEPQGATWTDPFTGKPLNSGVKADVHYPDKIRQDTREFVLFYHDEAGVVDPFGDPPVAPNGEIQAFYTLNYRGDSIDSRVNPKFLPFGNCNPGVDPAVCRDTDFFYNSWVHGDPGGGDMVFPTYSGDPVRFILIGASTEETHVHHLHEQRWKADSSFGESP
ncbi:MAG TPA: multicopper oxidase domain-containing protein, partial [Nitrososphaeraceae archaeon]|nr:multicopper oxidase domain-containing protein [Nitrososphaeraceae archaeon]